VISQSSIDLKVSSDGKSIGFYYSTDGIQWQVVRVFKNDYPEKLWLGISAQSPWGAGNTVIFSKCTFTTSSVKDFRMGV
jgi:regulation of enolase protein 1 (concanavalin A-like superfamily)